MNQNEYYDALYCPIDIWGYGSINPCLILGIVGPFIKILVWNKTVGDYIEFVVEPQTLDFEDPADKTSLLMMIPEGALRLYMEENGILEI